MTSIPVRYFTGPDGQRLAYREVGDGRPLILIHGYYGSGEMFTAEDRVAGRLAARGYRVILPDLRGHGHSAKPHDPAAYPPDALADDGLALIRHLGLTDYDLAGYSLGSRTAIRMLARGATPRRAVAGGQGLDAILHTVGRGGQHRRILAGFGTFEPGSPEQAMEDWITASGGDPVALFHIHDTNVNTTPEALAAITVPTLIVAGEDDGHNETAAALAAAMPAGQYRMVPGDHGAAVPHFEDALLEFLGDPVTAAG